MGSNQMRNAVLGVALAAAAGCASEPNAPAPYEDQFSRARESIEDATQAGAYEYGGADLSRARQKLDAAQRAADDGETERAVWLAQEAEVDAGVARATASNQEMQTALNELQESIETLQNELERNAQRGSNGDAGAAGRGSSASGQGG